MNDLLKDSKKLSPKQKAVFNTLHSMWKNQIADRAKNHEVIKTSEIVDVYSGQARKSLGFPRFGNSSNRNIKKFFKNIKKNATFLLPIISGALVSIFLFSNFLQAAFNNFYIIKRKNVL